MRTGRKSFWRRRVWLGLLLGIGLGVLALPLVAAYVLPDTKARTSAHFERGKRFFHARDYREAYIELKNVIQLDAGHAEAHYYLGLIYLAAGQQEQALDALRQSTSRKPELVASHVKLAELYFRAGDLHQAREKIRQSLVMAPENAYLHQLMGALLAAQKEYEQAEVRLRKALDLAPNLPQAHFLLGTVYEAEGRFARAEASYEQALDLAPDLAPAANNLAWLLAVRGTDLARARELAERARRQRPADVDVLDTLGWVCYRAGAFADAVSVLKIGTARAPDRAVFQFHLGMACYRNGDGAAAREAMQRFLTLAPTHAGADSARWVLAALAGEKGTP